MWRTYSDIMSPIRQPEWNRPKVTPEYLRDRQTMLKCMRNEGYKQIQELNRISRTDPELKKDGLEWGLYKNNGIPGYQLYQRTGDPFPHITHAEYDSTNMNNERGKMLDFIQYLEKIKGQTIGNMCAASDPILSLGVSGMVKNQKLIQQLDQEISELHQYCDKLYQKFDTINDVIRYHRTRHTASAYLFGRSPENEQLDKIIEKMKKAEKNDM